MLPVVGDIESIVYGLILDGGGGARIKSVQRGIGEVPAMQVALTVSISPVNLTRAIATLMQKADLWYSAAGSYCSIKLDTSSVRIERRRAQGNSPDVAWQVIEFAEGVTVQHLSVYAGTMTTNVTISPVDMNRAFVLATFRSGSQNDYYSDPLRNVSDTPVLVQLIAPDTVQVSSVSANGAYVEIMVVEVE